MRPKERGTDAQDQDRHRGRDRAEQARALGLDIPGREPRSTTHQPWDLGEASESPWPLSSPAK